MFRPLPTAHDALLQTQLLHPPSSAAAGKWADRWLENYTNLLLSELGGCFFLFIYFSLVSHLPQVLLRLAQALRAVDAVLDAAAVDGVVVLVVQQQRRHHDDVSAVRHRVAEVAQLAVVAGDHRVRVAAVWFSCRELEGERRESFNEEKWK